MINSWQRAWHPQQAYGAWFFKRRRLSLLLQVPVQVPAEFLEQLVHTAGPRSSAHTLDLSNPTAVLMPDVSLFPSVLPPGAPGSPCGSPCSNSSRRSTDDGSSTSTSVDIAMCSSSSMDVAGCGSSGSIQASFSVNSNSSSEVAVDAARRTESVEPWAGPAAVGPTLCVEVKPKCGFVESCATVHPDNHIKHSRCVQGYIAAPVVLPSKLELKCCRTYVGKLLAAGCVVEEGATGALYVLHWPLTFLEPPLYRAAGRATSCTSCSK